MDSLKIDLDQHDLTLDRNDRPDIVVETSDADVVFDPAPGDITVEFQTVGIPGRDGRDGVNGRDGHDGDGGLEYSPPSAQTTWLIPHNLGRMPLVTVALPDGEAIGCRVVHLDDNTTSIEFGRATIGAARLL